MKFGDLNKSSQQSEYKPALQLSYDLTLDELLIILSKEKLRKRASHYSIIHLIVYCFQKWVVITSTNLNGVFLIVSPIGTSSFIVFVLESSSFILLHFLELVKFID